jgi:hypothetical protein
MADRNVFAFALRMTHDYAAQLDQMQLIGPQILSSPWNHQGQPGEAYARARQAALDGAGRPGNSEWRPNPVP